MKKFKQPKNKGRLRAWWDYLLGKNYMSGINRGNYPYNLHPIQREDIERWLVTPSFPIHTQDRELLEEVLHKGIISKKVRREMLVSYFLRWETFMGRTNGEGFRGMEIINS